MGKEITRALSETNEGNVAAAMDVDLAEVGEGKKSVTHDFMLVRK